MEKNRLIKDTVKIPDWMFKPIGNIELNLSNQNPTEEVNNELIQLRQFVSEVAKGQQGELKGSFIIRIMNHAKKLHRKQEVHECDASKAD